MQTHKQFCDEWNGKPYHYDNAFGAECVDLFKGYSRDVKGVVVPVALWPAKTYYTDSAKWGVIKTPQPVEWDFAFTDYTEWWHVGIFVRIDKDTRYFWQFDQIWNWPKVWGEVPCKLRRYPISKLLWFVTYNKPSMDEPKMPLDELRKIWKECKTKKFNDYTVDERTKMLIDISSKR